MTFKSRFSGAARTVLAMKRWLGLGCLALVIVACLTSAGVLFYASRQVGALADASVACRGIPVGGVSASAPTLVLGFAQADSGSWNYAGTLVPNRFPSATRADESTIVFCFGPDARTVLEECGYRDGTVVRRYGHSREVRAVGAIDGRVLRAVNVSGPVAEACPATVTTATGGGIGVRVMGIPIGSVGGAPAPETVLEGGEMRPVDVETAFGDLVR